MRPVSSETHNRPENHAGYESPVKSVNGFRTCGHGVGKKQDTSPGESDPAICKKGGKTVLESLRNIEFDKAVSALEAQFKDSILYLEKAQTALNTVLSFLLTAESKVTDFPDGDRIGSLAMAVEDLECDLKKQIERMKNP